MEKEIWKIVDGYNGVYRVSNLGNFESCMNVGSHKPDGIWRRKRINRRKNGYYVVSLTKDGVGKLLYIHRLVASAFCPSPNDYKEIDHIDSDKSNNNASNLKWVSHKENLHNPHAIKERNKMAKERGVAISQYTLDGVFIKSYYSLREMGREHPNISRRRVKLCADGKLKSVCGFVWNYNKR